MAWLGERLHRAEKLPTLESLTGAPAADPNRRQTPEELMLVQRQWRFARAWAAANKTLSEKRKPAKTPKPPKRPRP